MRRPRARRPAAVAVGRGPVAASSGRNGSNQAGAPGAVASAPRSTAPAGHGARSHGSVVRRVDEVARGRRAAIGGPTRSRGRRAGAAAAGRRGCPRRPGPGRGRHDDDAVGEEHGLGDEWVTSTIVVPVRCQRSSSSALNRSRVRASRALNGSSSSSTAGSSASARAIATRWRVPPDRVDGLAPGELAQPDEAEQLVRARRLARRGQPASSIGKRDVPLGRPPREQPRLLEHEPDRAGPGPATGRPSIATAPASGAMQAREHAQQRALAAAVGADERDDLARRDVERRCRRAPWIVRAPRNVSETSSTRMPAPAERRGRGARADGRGRVDRASVSGARSSHLRRTSRAQRGRRRAACPGAGRAVDPRPSSIRTVPSAPAGAARAPPRICRAADVVRGAARGLVPRRGTLPPVGNRTLPRRLWRNLPLAAGSRRGSP